MASRLFPLAIAADSPATWPRRVPDLLLRDAGCGPSHDGEFNRPAGLEDVMGFLGRGTCDEGTAVGMESDDTAFAKLDEYRPDASPANPECGCTTHFR